MNSRSNEYITLHNWVRYHKGSAKECSNCGKTSGAIDWANISKEYKRDLEDFVALCRRCHLQSDWTICRKGLHALSGDNVYKHPTSGNKCRICKVQSRKEYKLRTGK